MNKVILLGRLTRDVETRNGQNCTVARVGIAVDRPFSKEKVADFFNLVAFGKTAEFLSKWFEKGSKILVEGRLQSSKYKNKEGKEVTAIEVIVEQVEFADAKKKTADNDFDGEPVADDDTPF